MYNSENKNVPIGTCVDNKITTFDKYFNRDFYNNTYALL